MARTFEEFAAAVKESCEVHAQRKNYTTDGIDGDNQLLNICVSLGIHNQHSIGEIIYKCAEFLRAPRPVIMEKVAGWAFVVWRTLPPEDVK